MLERLGVISDSEDTVKVTICGQCHAAVSRLALANGLFRGDLPSKFQDLAWDFRMMYVTVVSTTLVRTCH